MYYAGSGKVEESQFFQPGGVSAEDEPPQANLPKERIDQGGADGTGDKQRAPSFVRSERAPANIVTETAANMICRNTNAVSAEESAEKMVSPEHHREPHQGKQYDRDGQIEDVLDAPRKSHFYFVQDRLRQQVNPACIKKTKQAQTSIHRVSVRM